MADGTYRNYNYNTDKVDNSAVAAIRNVDDIIIRAMPGHSPKIEFDGAGGITLTNVNRAIVSGFEVEGPNQMITREEAMADRLLHSPKFSGRGIVVWSGTHIRIHDNVVHDTPNSGIRCNSADYVTVENNEVYQCTFWSSNAESAIVFAESAPADTYDVTKMIIRNNIVHDNMNKIPYYNSRYECTPDTLPAGYADCDAYLAEKQMHSARPNYGTQVRACMG